MDSTEDDKKNYFDTVPSEDVAVLLKALAKTNETISIWSEGKSGDRVEEYEVYHHDSKESSIEVMSKGFFLKKFKESSIIGEKVYIKLVHKDTQYFSFVPLLYSKESRSYKLFFEKATVFKARQRNDYRLKTKKEKMIQIKIVDAVFEGLDISAGGTSFLIEISDKERFEKGKVFTNCTLRFMDKDFAIAAIKIIGQWEYKDMLGNLTDKIRLGVSFSELAEDAENALCQAINSEARAEEVRKMFSKKRR